MIVPINLREANAFVAKHHSHHGTVAGCLFAIAEDRVDMSVFHGPTIICGVAIVGRPVSRIMQDGWTAELTRCCTDGTRYSASRLISRAWRIASLMGYRRMISYTLIEEHGASYKAAGWRMYGQAGGGTWDRAERPRVDTHPTQLKMRWEIGKD